MNELDELMSELIQIRAPHRLVAAIEQEARRQMLSKSAFIRQTLALRLGLADELPFPNQNGDERNLQES